MAKRRRRRDALVIPYPRRMSVFVVTFVLMYLAMTYQVWWR